MSNPTIRNKPLTEIKQKLKTYIQGRLLKPVGVSRSRNAWNMYERKSSQRRNLTGSMETEGQNILSTVQTVLLFFFNLQRTLNGKNNSWKALNMNMTDALTVDFIHLILILDWRTSHLFGNVKEKKQNISVHIISQLLSHLPSLSRAGIKLPHSS